MMAKLLRFTKHPLPKPTVNGLRRRQHTHQAHGIKRNNKGREDTTQAHMALCQGRSIIHTNPRLSRISLLRLRRNPMASQRQSNGKSNSSRARRIGRNNRNRTPDTLLMRNREGIQCRERHNSPIIKQLLLRPLPHRAGQISLLHKEDGPAPSTVWDSPPRLQVRTSSNRPTHSRLLLDMVHQHTFLLPQ
jgi:hypothetical protein